MGKKNNKPNPKAPNDTKVRPASSDEFPFVPDVAIPAWLCSFRIQAIVVAILAFSFYINTIKNEQALDDYIVIVKNEYVYQGLAGLGWIFTKDAYHSYYTQFNTGNQLSGGRYRPLSIATFAIEQQFFGAVSKAQADSILKHTDWGEMQSKPDQKFLDNMHTRHLFNVLWYTLSIVVLLYFLRYVVFKNQPLMAFFAAILFAIHPIHTEVVANVKSRDEILSLLFICCTFIFAFKAREQSEKKWLLFAGLLSYLLAFLSKEYAIGLVVLLPLAFMLFGRHSFSESIMATMPYFGVAALYVVTRLQVINTVDMSMSPDILTDPYAYASDIEKLATQIATPIHYLRLLIFPHPLSADYSYNSIPYVDFSSPLVWLSLAVHIGLIRAFFYCRTRHRVLSFAIAFYLVNLLLISNLIFNIGGTMGERLIYHSSLGFSIAVAWFLVKAMGIIKPQSIGKAAVAGCVLVLIALSAFKTIDRNKDWKNDITLFAQDIKVVPNSLLVNSNVAAYMISKGDYEKDEKVRNNYLREGIKMLDKAILLNKNNATSYFNKCVAYKYLNEPDSIVATLGILTGVYPSYPQIGDMYFQAGKLYLSNKQYDRASYLFQLLLKRYPGSEEIKSALKVANDSLQLLNHS